MQIQETIHAFQTKTTRNTQIIRKIRNTRNTRNIRFAQIIRNPRNIRNIRIAQIIRICLVRDTRISTSGFRVPVRNWIITGISEYLNNYRL